jgi:hypothetical protein
MHFILLIRFFAGVSFDRLVFIINGVLIDTLLNINVIEKKKYLFKSAAFIKTQLKYNDSSADRFGKLLIALFRPYCDFLKIQLDSRKYNFDADNSACFVIHFQVSCKQIKSLISVADTLRSICQTIDCLNQVDAVHFHIYENEDELHS